MSASLTHISIIVPAKDEADSLPPLLQKLRTLQPAAEILVVDDGSIDATADIARQAGARVVRQPYSMGNGAAIKAGARAAHGEILICMDADGQHAPEDIAKLLQLYEQGFDMVIGARTGGSHASLWRRIANGVYNALGSWMVGHRIADLTSGFRVSRAELFKHCLHLLPNGFSYPTTITMAFFRAGYRVGYVSIEAGRRRGRSSHISPLRDGVRFLLIIFKIATLYSPFKIFLPISALFFCTGSGYYLYTYLEYHRFTNMSALMIITSVLIFLIGLVSEQITNLLYSRNH